MPIQTFALDYFGTAKRYYDLGYYSKEDIAIFVERGKITAEQYEEITGDVYYVTPPEQELN